jgi:hypothetical protein
MVVAIGTLVFFVQALMVGSHTNVADNYMLLKLITNDDVVQKTTQVIISIAALFDYRLSFSCLHVSDALWWWVKPRSTTWFSHFLMTVYDGPRWIDHFRMSKEIVFETCNKLRPYIE